MQRRSLVGAVFAGFPSALAFPRTSTAGADRPSAGPTSVIPAASYAMTDDGVRLDVRRRVGLSNAGSADVDT